MLEIKNLHVKVKAEDKLILKGVNLNMRAGEVHAIMGPNGSGKSTLGYCIVGKPGYEIVEGDILFQGESIQNLDVVERAALGFFLGMQYPLELPGVNNAVFLRLIYNKTLQAKGREALDAIDFLEWVKAKMTFLGMDQSFLKRNVNEGFSGGEKKRNEVLQMLLLEPALVILDELDSGLDIDALQWVAKAVNHLRSPERSFLLITHYQRLLGFIVPDYVHVLVKGKIVESGGRALALQLEERGYAGIY